MPRPTGASAGKSKAASYSRQKRSRDALGAALDLDLPQKLHAASGGVAGEHVDDDDLLVHNRGAKATGKKSRISAVLPQDAHKTMQFDKEESAFAEQEEEQLAEEANRAMREELDDDDFAVPGFKEAVSAAGATAATSNVSTEAIAVEQVARDFSELSNSEQLTMLQKQSPELVKMFGEMKLRLADVQTTLPQTSKLRNLIQAQKRKKIQTSETNAILTFLETKLQLLLSYCIHINFYLLLKAEGKKVENHPVVDRLLEIRVYLEKLWPLEQKLGYTLSKLLSGGTKAMGNTKAQLGNLRSVADEDGGVYRPTKNAMLDSDAAKRRKMVEEQEAAELEAEETSLMTRARMAKKGGKKGDKSAVEMTGNEAEPEDHFFSKVVRGSTFDDEEEEEEEQAEAEEGMTLVERLKARQNRTDKVVSGLQAKTANKKQQQAEQEAMYAETGGEGMDDMAFENSEDEAEYQRLVAEEGEGEDDDEDYEDEEGEEEDGEMEYESEKKRKFSAALEDDEKRGVSKKILANRGATKSRRKDRKTPHTNRKQKVKKGERIAKTQTRAFKPLGANAKFEGVTNLKPHLTKSRSMAQY